MNETPYDPALRGLVRRYSLQVAEASPNDPLCQALGASAKQDEAMEQQLQESPDAWRRWLEFTEPSSDELLVRLDQAKQRVADTWKEFSSGSNIDHPDEISKGPPKIEALLLIVKGSQNVWTKSRESGIGKAKSTVESFMGTLNDYSFLFNVIPNGSMYTSVVNGVVSNIVKASVNHQKVADGFSEAVEDITARLKTIKTSVIISNSMNMKFLVVDLYVEVFDFLSWTMTWYQKRGKRFRKAFNKNYAEKIREKVLKIRQTIDRIGFAAEQATQVRVKHVDETISSMEYDLQYVKEYLQEISDGSRNRVPGPESSDARRLERVAELLEMGKSGRNVLLATGQHCEHDRRQDTNSQEASSQVEVVSSTVQDSACSEAEELEAETEDDAQELPQPLCRSEVELWASKLDSFLMDGSNEILKALNAGINKSTLPREVLDRVQRWAMEPTSNILWVRGPYGLASVEQQLSRASVEISGLFLEAGIPCISFTPKPGYDVDRGEESSTDPPIQVSMLVALLYSIIAQLVNLLPSEFQSAGDIDQHAFHILDGSAQSIPAALDLIETLLYHAPPSLVVIIDRFQLAESPETRLWLLRLGKMLRALGTKQLVKLLYTTTTSCDVLEEMTEPEERMYAARMVQGIPGQHRPGGRGRLVGQLHVKK